MPSLTNIMDAMAEQIAAAMEAADERSRSSRGMVFNPTPPSIDIYPASELRDPATAGFEDLDGGYIFTVRARVSTADNEAGQDTLLRFCDDEDELCIPLALLDDPDARRVRDEPAHPRHQRATRSTPTRAGNGALLGCQFRVLVLKAES